MTERIIGYSLLALGIIIMVVVAINVVGVFMGSREPTALLKEEGSIMSLDFTVPGQGGLPTASVPVEINNYSQILKIVNLVLYVVFSGFFASIGYKIAMVGANLVRPVVVKSASGAFKDKLPQADKQQMG